MTGDVGDDRIGILYLAPWVDFGGSDKGTIDWFRWLDRDRFRPSLITTQPSANRRLAEVEAYAEEVWALPDLMAGHQMPAFIFDFIVSRRIRVLHIMNARLGYELLPDLASLDVPPAVVVQLHVEEQDRSGYVRLVTTRYGNLVDAFSVSSEHLADAVEGYDVHRDRVVVIRTGVDAAQEFSPERVAPHDLGRGPHVLYPGRLTAQKDPLLMVDVATRVVAERPDVRFHVVGDGDLETEVRARVRARNLDEQVVFHPPAPRLAPWYAASDVLLMTSVFEGVPYVVYEAMAMGLPVVAPQLLGNAELMGGEAGALIEPREDAQAYALAILALLNDDAGRARVGAQGHARVRRELTVQRMAAEHAHLYERLLDAQTSAKERQRWVSMPEPVRLPARQSRGRALVSVIVPCFNHGRYLSDCLATIRAQSYPELEVFVVDDCSTDSRTRAVLAELEADPSLTVLRQPENHGPSAARNAALERARGRYVLPVDADNLLLPGAIETLVEQLQTTNELVGYVYPNLQFFGNRNDYVEVPDFNLDRLKLGNYCDTCSLIDRSIFDAGFRYPEEIRLGHEDWDFALTLAERGIRGEAAHAKTLRYRKHGFTRSDVVEAAREPFVNLVRERHPVLYPSYNHEVDVIAARHVEAVTKAAWRPAVSIVALEELQPVTEWGQTVATNLARQSVVDAELIAAFDGLWPLRKPGPAVRRIPPAWPERLSAGIEMARGNYVVVVQHGLGALLADRAFVDKLLRARFAAVSTVGIAFVDARTKVPFELLDASPGDAQPHALALFELDGDPELAPFQAPCGGQVPALVRLLAARGRRLQWRHAPAGTPAPAAGERCWTDPRPRAPRSARERAERDARRARQPALHTVAWDIRRWAQSHHPAWLPAGTDLLFRHREAHGERRLLSTVAQPPDGYVAEHWLGAIQRSSPPGTMRLEAVLGGDGEQVDVRLVDREAPTSEPEAAQVLGHVERAAFPLLQSLELAYEPVSGRLTIVAGANDMLRDRVEVRAHLGWIEAFPNLPDFPEYPQLLGSAGFVLLRAVDRQRRRHVYGVGAVPFGRRVARLGRVLPERVAGSIAFWTRRDGTLETERHRPPAPTPDVRRAARWVAAPVAWRGHGAHRARARAALRRTEQAARQLVRPAPTVPSVAGASSPAGYLYAEPAPDRTPIYSAVHSVTGDQLVTPYLIEAGDMGYGDATLLGHVLADAGEVSIERYSVPWASRFGLEARRT